MQDKDTISTSDIFKLLTATNNINKPKLNSGNLTKDLEELKKSIIDSIEEYQSNKSNTLSLNLKELKKLKEDAEKNTLTDEFLENLKEDIALYKYEASDISSSRGKAVESKYNITELPDHIKKVDEGNKNNKNYLRDYIGKKRDDGQYTLHETPIIYFKLDDNILYHFSTDDIHMTIFIQEFSRDGSEFYIDTDEQKKYDENHVYKPLEDEITNKTTTDVLETSISNSTNEDSEISKEEEIKENIPSNKHLESKYNINDLPKHIKKVDTKENHTKHLLEHYIDIQCKKNRSPVVYFKLKNTNILNHFITTYTNNSKNHLDMFEEVYSENETEFYIDTNEQAKYNEKHPYKPLEDKSKKMIKEAKEKNEANEKATAEKVAAEKVAAEKAKKSTKQIKNLKIASTLFFIVALIALGCTLATRWTQNNSFANKSFIKSGEFIGSIVALSIVSLLVISLISAIIIKSHKTNTSKIDTNNTKNCKPLANEKARKRK